MGGMSADMKALSVRIERLRELFDLDRETGVLTRKVRTSYRIKVGDVAGSLNHHGYLMVRVDGKRLGAHRVVFALANGYWPEQVDHVNGVRTDNRPANLRAATREENQHNARRPVTNKSGVKGVSLDKASGKWRAYCWVNNRQHSIGYFTAIEAAAAAVRAARERLHGEFARHD